jgi:hypothetical protein
MGIITKVQGKNDTFGLLLMKAVTFLEGADKYKNTC